MVAVLTQTLPKGDSTHFIVYKTRTDKYDYCLIEHVLIVRQGSCSSVEV